MKCRFLFALLFALITTLAAAPFVYSAEVLEVIPTGTFPDDAVNVQAALDSVGSPGTVILKSTNAAGDLAAFNFGDKWLFVGTVIKLVRPDITLTGDGWDEDLNEPKTKIVGGGGSYQFSPTVSGISLVFAVNAPGVTIRDLKLTTAALTGVFISSANQQANDHPVVVERNDLSAVTYCVLASFSAAFPVKISNNVLRGAGSVGGWWIGYTVQLISTSPGDEPIEPRDASDNVVRYPFEITTNRIIKTPISPWMTVWVYGWTNEYSTDPEVGNRRIGSVDQFVSGDNGPVLISGNEITMASAAKHEAIVLGTPSAGLSHARVMGNTVFGKCMLTLWASAYGHDNFIMDNDFSEAQPQYPISITAADTTFTGNILTSPFMADLPALVLISIKDWNKNPTPMPNPVENCVFMKNDYRLIEPDRPAIILASEMDLQASSGIGGEVKNNLIFETGRFPEETGGPKDMIQILVGPPFVHDNRIIGHPAKEIKHPGIGQIIAPVIQMMMEEPAPGF
jgi:hypothetical protein